MDVTVAVATYGDVEWFDRARSTAVPSGENQALTIHVHHASLAQARNAALERVETEWVVYLDADDELESGYVEALSAAVGDLRAPAVRYVGGRGVARPRMPRVVGHRHRICGGECLRDGNWLVVGTAVRADLAREVGGWKPWPIYEDWDLFLRCWLAGAAVEAVPQAVYRAHFRPDSRNREPDQAFRRRIHEQIYEANFGEPMAAA